MGLPPGTRFGPYRIVAPLGVGGMGEVYRAHDDRLDRDVALKVLPEDPAGGADGADRLLKEARAAAAFNHPNICTIHDVGAVDGRPYIAMEVVEGEPLNARIARGRFSIPDLLRYAGQLADALAHAHDRSVVHRDLTTHNIIVTGDGHVKVLDFGLAKRLSAVTDATTAVHTISAPGTITGTLPYMAPEVLRGRPADMRSDTWALGVVLYEMATGVRPFVGGTPFEVTSSILQGSVPPLPATVPAGLQLIIEHALEPEPARRYQRGGEIRIALATIDATATGTGPGRPRTDAVTPRRRTSAITAIAVGALLVAALAGIALRQRWLTRATRIQSLAVLPLENLSQDPNQEYFVAGVQDALITDLARIGLRKVVAKASADMFRGTKKPPSEIGRDLGVDALVTGSVRQGAGRVQVTAQLLRAGTGAVLWANRYERAAGDVLSLQNDLVGAIARELRAALSPETEARLAAARPVNPAAHDAYLKGRYLRSTFPNSVSRQNLDAIVAQLEEAIRLDPAYAPPYADLSLVHATAAQTSFRSPTETNPLAKAAALKAVELDGSLAEAHAALATVMLWQEWDWAAADREISRALQLNPTSVDSLLARVTLETLIQQRFDDAAATSQHILDIDPLNPMSRVQNMWVAHFSHRYDDSIRQARVLADLAPEAWFPHFFLASNYAAKHLGADATAECRRMRELMRGAYDMQALGMCAWALGFVGQRAEAERLIDIVQRPPAGLWLDPGVMALALSAIGKIDQALEWTRKGLDERAPNMIYVRSGPAWSILQPDRRFQALIRRLNLP